MKIFHCKKKQIFIVKEKKEEDPNNINNDFNEDLGDNLADKFQVNLFILSFFKIIRLNNCK